MAAIVQSLHLQEEARAECEENGHEEGAVVESLREADGQRYPPKTVARR
jgi:hypothetical protein